MITGYHRPTSLDEALLLLGRMTPVTLPLGGGTSLSHQRGDAIEVVDLQSLGLEGIKRIGASLEVGAMASLQATLEHPDCPKAMTTALRLEAPLNLRNAASVGGTLMLADGRSTFVATLLALDASLKIRRPQEESIPLGEFLPLRKSTKHSLLITSVRFPLSALVEFDYVARTPADRPIVAVALALWPSGRLRVTAAGFGLAPALALDGTQRDDLSSAVRNSLHGATDPWGSSEYRMDVAATLAQRSMDRLESATSQTTA